MSNYEEWMPRLRQMFPGKTDAELVAMVKSGKVKLVDEGWPAFADFEQPKTLSALIGFDGLPQQRAIDMLTDPVPEDPEEWKKYAREREEWKELAKEAKQERFDKAMTRKHLRDIGAEGGKKSKRRHPARDLFELFRGKQGSAALRVMSRSRLREAFGDYLRGEQREGRCDPAVDLPSGPTLEDWLSH